MDRAEKIRKLSQKHADKMEGLVQRLNMAGFVEEEVDWILQFEKEEGRQLGDVELECFVEEAAVEVAADKLGLV